MSSSIAHLIAIGVGSTIGAGVYNLVGTVARGHSGPALAFSFLIAGIAAALSAFCYAELASRCPSARSAYHYSYICVGEGSYVVTGSSSGLNTDRSYANSSSNEVHQLKEKLQKIEDERAVEREENARREEENRQMSKRLKDIEAMLARQYPPLPPYGDTPSRDHPLFR